MPKTGYTLENICIFAAEFQINTPCTKENWLCNYANGANAPPISLSSFEEPVRLAKVPLSENLARSSISLSR